MSDEFKRIQVSNQDDVLVLEILDAKLTEYEQSRELEQELTTAIAERKATKVIIDCKNVEYMISVALFCFVSARKIAETLDGRIVLCNLSEVVAKVLTVTQLIVERRSHARYLEMSDDMESAIAQLKQDD